MSKLSVDDLLAEFDDLPKLGKQQRTLSDLQADVPKKQPSVPSFVSSAYKDHQPAHASHASNPAHTQAVPVKQSQTGPQTGLRSSLDDLFDDFGDLPTSASTSSAPTHASAPGMAKSGSGGSSFKSSSSSSQNPSLPKPVAKCMGIFLGGPNRERGRNGSSIGNVLCCDHLRCV